MDANPPTKFVNPPSNSLFCLICRKLFVDPVISILCGHTFCRKCVESRLRSRTLADCPVDNVDIDITNLVPNRAVQGQLEDLLIYCRHSLYRVDSDDDFQIAEDGCKEHITLGKRTEHEGQCLSAWVPCPNSSNHCGKFRKRDFEAHLLVCSHNPCRNSNKGCEFAGTIDEIQSHTKECFFSCNSVEWDTLAAMDGESSGDGLESKSLVSVVKNLHERVTSLENSKDSIISLVEKCTSNVINLSSQVEKLAYTMEQIRLTQNALIKQRFSTQSVSDLEAITEYRRSVSIYGLNMYGSARTRSQTSNLTDMFGFSETKHETWKMPLSFKCVGTFRGHTGIIRAVTARGPYIFSGGADHTVKVWDIKDKDMKNSRGCIATLTGHSGDVHALCTAGGFLYSAGTDKSIKVWNIEKIQLHLSREDAHSDVIGALATTGKYIFSGSYSSIKIWRVITLELMHTVADIHHWIRAFAVHPKKKFVYSGSHNTVHIWEADEPFSAKGNLVHSHGSVYSISATNNYLVIGTYNQNTHIYDIKTYQYVKVLNGHIGIINDLLASPSGNFLFTASFDSTIQLWDMIKLLPIQVLSRHEGSVNCVALRGDMLFTGSDDKEIKVYLYYQGLASKNLMVV